MHIKKSSLGKFILAMSLLNGLAPIPADMEPMTAPSFIFCNLKISDPISTDDNHTDTDTGVSKFMNL